MTFLLKVLLVLTIITIIALEIIVYKTWGEDDEDSN